VSARREERGHATVLAVAHTVTSATRLLDVLPVLEGDHRVRVTFSAIPGSSFGAGVPEFLAEVGGATIPWEEATRRSFDLALAAGNSGELHRIKAPLIIIPHGIGYNKYFESRIANRESRIANRESAGRHTAWRRSSFSMKATSSRPGSSFRTKSSSSG
jgi:hypothetical protein